MFLKLLARLLTMNENRNCRSLASMGRGHQRGEGGICIVNAVSAQFHCEAGASGTAFTFYFVAKIFDALHPRRIG